MPIFLLFSVFFFVVYVFCLFFFVFFCQGAGLMCDLVLFGGSMSFSFCFLFDYLSFGFFSCVSFICGVVFFYVSFYMAGVVDLRRFLWMVFLFVVSMFLLVFSGNFFVVLVGWDGLGLISFCLVMFYYNALSLESSLVTVFSNRVGDAFFLLSFFFFFVGGTLSFDIFFYWTGVLFLIFIFCGAITKSAQVPFSAWLPAAMAAPTPVSSLVHSSTLVTAGIYVLIRFNYLFVFLNMSFFKVFSVFTMLLAGAAASLESDFKKVVAFSTLSQLGMLLFILSMGSWMLSFMHMMIHAFFKSMLFLSTGSLMSQSEGAQDARRYGMNSFNYSSYLFFVVSGVCLSGFPFFIGFYSKDLIISSSSFLGGMFLYMLFLIGCCFTVCYSFRLVFEGYLLGLKSTAHFLMSESGNFLFPVFFLFFKGWLVGGCFFWGFFSEGFYFFSFLDVMLGCLLLVGGGLLYCFLYWLYLFSFVFFSLFFFRWGSFGGFTFLLKSNLMFKLEGGWLEMVGSQGVYEGLKSGTFFIFGISSLRLGVLFFLVLAGFCFI